MFPRARGTGRGGQSFIFGMASLSDSGGVRWGGGHYRRGPGLFVVMGC